MRARDLAIVKAAITPSAPVTEDDLRPTTFADIIGQADAVAQLRLLCDAATARNEVAPHILIDGPPGLGKTTLAGAIASAMGGQLFVTTGQSIGLEQLGKRLSTQRRGSIVFVDECHTLSKAATTMLLGALEDGCVDMTTQVGPERREVKPFTLIGATTNPGDLARPLKDRFGHVVQLSYYSVSEMLAIMERSAHKLKLDFEDGALLDIAERANGTPRIANQYIQRVRDYWQVHHSEHYVTADVVMKAFEFFNIDELGLAPRDRTYVTTMYQRFRGGPVGGENMAIALGMDYKTIANDIEPLLLRLGLIYRAPRGRTLTDDGRMYARELLGEPE